jgi:hypothetical protein
MLFVWRPTGIWHERDQTTPELSNKREISMLINRTKNSPKGIKLCYISADQEGFSNGRRTITLATEVIGRPSTREIYRFTTCTFSSPAPQVVDRLRAMNSMSIIAGGAGIRVVDNEGVSLFTAKACMDLTPANFGFKLPPLIVNTPRYDVKN